MKKIGVVVPVYNAGPYLEQCVNSIINQTYKDWELVLVDDGSTDNSGKICDKYESLDSRIRVIHQGNRGKLVSRYIGLKQLKSEYATFVDADDWIEADTYERIIEYMQKGIDMISYKIIRYFDETYQYTSQYNYDSGLYEARDIKEKIYPTMIWNTQRGSFGLDPSLCNKVVKKEFLIEALYNAQGLQIGYGDDVAVVYAIIKRIRSLMLMDESFYFHRQRKKKDIADYLVDREYYKKLYCLYEYLVEQFQGDKDAIRQIDYFYVASTQYHLQIYGDNKAGRNYLFPFHKVKVNKRIILYGASVVGQTYYQQYTQLNYGTIVAWVDQNYEAYKDFGVKDVECIKSVKNIDYVVIAVANEQTARSIKTNLIGMNIEDNKIIWEARWLE